MAKITDELEVSPQDIIVAQGEKDRESARDAMRNPIPALVRTFDPAAVACEVLASTLQTSLPHVSELICMNLACCMSACAIALTLITNEP